MKNILSIIIPVYNTQNYLKRCVDSLIAQTYPNIEIILIDDGSTDDSGKLCDSYALKHNNIHVLHQSNQGQSMARNNGIEHSSGDFISFVDSDDYIADPTTFESCIAAFDSNIDVVQYPYRTRHADSTKDYLFSFKTTDAALPITQDAIRDAENQITLAEGRICQEIRAASHWTKGIVSTAVCDKVFRRNILEDIKFRPMFLEDVVAIVDIIRKIKNIRIISNGEYAYCIRENSTLTSNWTKKKSMDEIDSILHVYNLIHHKAQETEQEQTTFLWIVSMMTALRINFGINWMNMRPGTFIPIPRLRNASKYNKLRLSMIKVFGLKSYIDFAYHMHNAIKTLKK